MTFEQFYTKLQENSIWFDQLPLAYPNRNIMKIARTYHTWLLGMESKFDNWPQIRVVFQKFLWQAGEEVEQPKYDKAEPIQMAENVLRRETPEYIEACQKMLDMIAAAPMWQKPVPVLDDSEGELRKKPHGTFHPSTSEEELKKHERHIEYIRQNYDAVTGAKLPTWIAEDEWNKPFLDSLKDKI